jgi:hypothetical protein
MDHKKISTPSENLTANIIRERKKVLIKFLALEKVR